MKMMATVRLAAFGLVALAVGVPSGASALSVWGKLDIPNYASGDTAYLCSNGSQFFEQTVGRNSSGTSVCVGNTFQTGFWNLSNGNCPGAVSVSGYLRAGSVSVGPIYCSVAGGWNTIVSCNANMTLRRNSPTAACAFKTATGNAFGGT